MVEPRGVSVDFVQGSSHEHYRFGGICGTVERYREAVYNLPELYLAFAGHCDK